MADEIPDQVSREQLVMRHTFLTFDAARSDSLCQHLPLLIFYQVKKWLWTNEGVYSFLTGNDQTALALTCYAAYREHYERITDDAYFLSPRQDNENVIARVA